MDSLSSSIAASSPLFSVLAGELKSSDMIFTLTGSASALRRRATCRASSSFMGPAAMGAQQTGADMSIVGKLLGTNQFCHRS